MPEVLLIFYLFTYLFLTHLGYTQCISELRCPKFLKLIILQIRTLRGHTNEKNFVGLTVNNEYIACGSESNEVFVYHKVRPRLYIHFFQIH